MLRIDQLRQEEREEWKAWLQLADLSRPDVRGFEPALHTAKLKRKGDKHDHRTQALFWKKASGLSGL